MQNQTLNEAQFAPLAEQFHRDGYCVVPNVFPLEQIAAFRARADELYADTSLVGTEYLEDVMGAAVLRHIWELDPMFRDALASQPVLGLVEALLGGAARVCGNTFIRNEPGQAITLWHIDDAVEFPLPPEVPRHDARIQMPILWLGVQIPLTDIDAEEFGPTEFVPGSQYSGRWPDNQDNPHFDGRGPEFAFCKAGDIYIQNFQCWHRGAPNTSNRTRYLLQMQYAKSWASARFGNTRLHKHNETTLSGASDEVKAVLGCAKN